MTLASQIASDLLDIKAVYLKPEEPFTWASGIKSPIYTDNRITLSYPETRTHLLKMVLWKRLRKNSLK